MPVMMPGDDADGDAGDAGKVHSVEPEAFDDVPMSGASSIPELGTILKGVETVAMDGVATQPLPALGPSVLRNAAGAGEFGD
jgi:hypothetical protein